MSQLSAAINVDTAKNIASGVSVGTVVIALLAIRLVKNMLVRVVTIVALLAIGLASYSQRTNIVDCAPKDVKIGMAVEVYFTPVDEAGTIHLPFWRPAA